MLAGLVLPMHLWLVVGAPAEAPIEPIQTTTIEYIMTVAEGYGVSGHEMVVTLNCESSLRHEGIFGDGGKAYGIAQFHEPTFEMFKQSAIKAGYPFDDFSYQSDRDQIELMAWAFKNGLQKHWTCWSKNF